MSLLVDASIPHGNATDVSVCEADGAWAVEFAAHPHGGPECLWFCFRIRQASAERPAGGKVRLVLKHFDNMLGGGDACNVRPVLSRAGAPWERLGPPDVELLPDGRRRLSWTAEAPATFLDVALCYPYGQPELRTLLADTRGYWRRDTIGVSQAGRPLLRLSNAIGPEGDARPGLYLIARQHSGETPGSWVLDGFLRRLAERDERGVVVWAVPLSNVDGVEQGDYGKDNFPYDLNRAWGESPMRHETLVLQRDVGRWATRCRPAFAADFHAPGATEFDGVYAWLPDSDKEPERHKTAAAWAEAVRAALGPEFAAPEFGRVARYRSRWETPTFTAFCASVGGLPASSMETPYALCGERALSIEDYREIGRRTAEGAVRKALGG